MARFHSVCTAVLKQSGEEVDLLIQLSKSCKRAPIKIRTLKAVRNIHEVFIGCKVKNIKLVMCCVFDVLSFLVWLSLKCVPIKWKHAIDTARHYGRRKTERDLLKFQPENQWCEM